MKKIGIIAAMEEEIKILREAMDKAKETELGGSVFIEGHLKGQPAVIVQSGIGKVNAAIAAVLLIREFGCDHLLNTGSAGGVGEGLKVGDVVLSTELAYHDADARVFGYKMGQIPQMPAVYPADETMCELAAAAAVKEGMQVKKGIIVTGDSFVSDGVIRDTILHSFPKAQVVEMEGAAIAQTCWKFNIPCLIIRAVSDTADQEAAVSFDDFILEAGRKSGQMVLEFLRMTKVEKE